MSNQPKVFSLLQLLQSISNVISKSYDRTYWIKAEIAKINEYKYSGHCYPELVEKQSGKVAAQIRAIIWAKTYHEIKQKFENTTKEPLREGMTVVFLVQVSFDPMHGLSLQIVDIDPSFTLGDMMREKIMTIERLQKEGIFDKNKKLTLPTLPHRLAVISVHTSKGFQDFNNVLKNCRQQYKPLVTLFPTLLQGNRAAESLMKAFGKIRNHMHLFDAVIILRGGGSDIGLNCYDDFELSETIANFPLPVITGIGHSTNETVTEMVAWKNMITPTEAAYFIIDRFRKFEEAFQSALSYIVRFAKQEISQEKHALNGISLKIKNMVLYENLSLKHQLSLQESRIKSLTKSIIENKEEKIEIAVRNMQNAVQNILQNKNRQLNAAQNSLIHLPKMLFQSSKNYLQIAIIKAQSFDPKVILEKGFSITKIDGKSIEDLSVLNENDIIQTELKEGNIISIIKKIIPNE